MKLTQIGFVFEGVTVVWKFIDDHAPNYLINVIGKKSKSFTTSKAPTVNNARKFAKE